MSGKLSLGLAIASTSAAVGYGGWKLYSRVTSIRLLYKSTTTEVGIEENLTEEELVNSNHLILLDEDERPDKEDLFITRRHDDDGGVTLTLRMNGVIATVRCISFIWREQTGTLVEYAGMQMFRGLMKYGSKGPVPLTKELLPIIRDHLRASLRAPK